jgi:predicted aconitase
MPRRFLALTADEQRMLDGDDGEARKLAMRILCRIGAAVGARRLIPVASAHVDGCLYHGQASVDFGDRLAGLGARVTVPTTLNVGSLDLLHPDLVHGDATMRADARRLMDAYVAMGCRPTWTCAPYQLPDRPRPGVHVAWAESNAIVFANSVLGARTDRYGDFIDICAAVTGRVPDAGLHRDENRRGEIVFDITALPERMLAPEILAPVLGYVVGRRSGPRVPVIVGLPPGTGEDALKALGATAASSGSVALFHAVGFTPEAPTLADALNGSEPDETVVVDVAMMQDARDALGTLAPGAALDAVSVGTPHFSIGEFGRLVELLDRHAGVAAIDFYVATSRFVAQEADRRGWLERCRQARITIVTDTCTYVTPILRGGTRTVMTNSGKWAYYAPGNLGVTPVFATLQECVLSAIAGEVVRAD